jgi:electron transport complex protein RnfC
MIGGLKIPNPLPMNDFTIHSSVLPNTVILPIYDEIPLVAVGDKVLTGQVLAKGSVWTHASISGEVIDISPQHIPHPAHLKVNAITIQGDAKDDWVALNSTPDWTTLHADVLFKKLEHSGISGLGGAGFPTPLKIQHTQNCQTIIINGCECEPAVEADNGLMLEYPREILQGTAILLKITGANNAIIAIEDDKQEAFEQLLMLNNNDNITISQVPTIYGSGSEKSLIQTLLDITVASGKFASEYGILMQNVATTKAIYDAIVLGKPLIERVITDMQTTPFNKMVRIGEVIAGKGLRFGGIMMGQNLQDTSYPLLKTTNAIVKQLPENNNIRECIRCGECVKVCPAELLPQQLYWFAKSGETGNIEKCVEYHLMDCTQCRCCDEVCPSNIPLSEYFQFAKRQNITMMQEKKLAENASKRFEFREYRLQRNKQERDEMMAKKRAAIKKKMAKVADEKSKDDATQQTQQVELDKEKANATR